MKYTRYDIKRKNNKNKLFLLAVTIVLVGAFIIGTTISNFFYKNVYNVNQIGNAASNGTISNNGKSTKGKAFTIIQCGIFSKKENADELLTALSKIGKPFEVQEDNKIRVLFGIYCDDDKSKTALNLLSNNKYDTNEIKYNLDLEDKCDLEIYEIITSQLQIIDKLSDENVKGIQTLNFKSYVKNMGSIEGANNTKVLKELKSYMSKLPEVYTKTSVDNDRIFVYKELKECLKK